MFLPEDDTCYLSEERLEGTPPDLYSKFANRKMQILLVEDHPILQHIHKVMLSEVLMLIKLQGEVEIAKTGEEALEMAQGRDYDLIFLDIGLPGISGTEVARKLRLLKRHLQTRLVALTTTYENAKEYLSAGIEEVLPKPTNMEKLKDVVCSV